MPTKSLVTQSYLSNEQATLTFANEKLVPLLKPGISVFLNGPLGAGKTTLARGVLRAMGHEGAVKSPTFTLVEPYEELDTPIYHMDLYRLGTPDELDFVGLENYCRDDAICLIEWPDKGEGYLPPPSLWIDLEPQQQAKCSHGRTVSVYECHSNS